jgi:hypothetical protein
VGEIGELERVRPVLNRVTSCWHAARSSVPGAEFELSPNCPTTWAKPAVDNAK